MAFMDWDASLELGDPTIDRQHKRLVALINDVHAACAPAHCSSPDNGEDIMRCISAMFLYAREHFLDEEALVRRLPPAERDRHLVQHKEFVGMTHALADKFLADAFVPEEMLNFLVGWLREHIALLDAHLVSIKRADGPNEAAD